MFSAARKSLFGMTKGRSGAKGFGGASPIVFGPRTLVRTWGTPTELWVPRQA
jgi:hypothetical protein